MSEQEFGRINIRVQKEIKEKFKQKLEVEGRNVTDVIIAWILDYLENANESDTQDLQKQIDYLNAKIAHIEKDLMGKLAA